MWNGNGCLGVDKMVSREDELFEYMQAFFRKQTPGEARENFSELILGMALIIHHSQSNT